MLDCKAKLIVLAFFLAMMASAIWFVDYAVRWSAILFFLPACLMIFVGVWQWRMARAEGDLSAWSRWIGFLAISYAVICAGFQLMFVMALLKVIAPPSALLVIRLLIGFFGVQLIVLGNWKAKLPPLRGWRPDGPSLGAADEAAILRFEGWLLVTYGLIVIASAPFIPFSLIAPLFGSMSAASLIVVLIRRRQLRKTSIAG
jgi:hypothetical protein